MEKQYKKLKLSFGFLIILAVMMSLVSAFGVTTYYWETNPLIMYPGQTKNINVELQNMVGGADLRLKAELTEGMEIATLIDPDEEYLIPFGRKDIKVNIKVVIPENVPLEDKYYIKIAFKEAATEEGKMLQMASSVGATIPVVIKSIEEVPAEQEQIQLQEEEQVSVTTIVVLSLVILAIIIGYIIFKFKKKKK